MTQQVQDNSGLEWPTILVLAGTYLAFGFLTWFAASIPWYALLPLGGYVVCLHGSLQHEALHGHPSRSPLLNEATIFPALGLWMPYRRYVTLHTAHHDVEALTDPLTDPESYYWTPAQWQALPRLVQIVLNFNNTLPGRLLIGPILAMTLYYRSEIKAIAKGDRQILWDWMVHGLAVAVALTWIVAVCEIPVWRYVLFFAYPGLSLTLLRSFAEHRAHGTPAARTAILETGPAMALLFLNNNLHAPHHTAPALAWYRLPDYYRQNREAFLERNEGYLIDGYSELVRRYSLHPRDRVAHPVA